jgi:lipoprotein-anchoring transpeptidase ErfK/SrfK
MRKAVQLLVAITALQSGLIATPPTSAYAFHDYDSGFPGYDPSYRPGTIVVKTSERRLYLLVGDGQTLVYPVAVGRPGKAWTGVAKIDGKYLSPAWSPPPDVRRDRPNMPHIIPGGAQQNPMGVAALTLSGGDYAIHGTNAPNSIGRSVSYGCIRMHNRDIMDLYQRVKIGTPVIVMH